MGSQKLISQLQKYCIQAATVQGVHQQSKDQHGKVERLFLGKLQVMKTFQCFNSNFINSHPATKFMRFCLLLFLIFCINTSYQCMQYRLQQTINQKQKQKGFNMGSSKSKPGIHIHTQRNVYVPGQIVQGCVYINAQQAFSTNKIMLIVQGFQKTWWHANAQGQVNSVNSANNISSGTNNTLQPLNGVKPNQPKVPFGGDRMGQCKVIEATFMLNNWGNSNTLHGQYAFPFDFQLPKHIPGSFRQQKPDYKASIIYEISCQIVSTKKGVDDVILKQQLIVREPKKPNQQSLYGQIYLYPQTCCCTKNGVAKICCYFQKNQYMPGEECIAICEADNYKCNLNITQIKMKFKKTVTLVSAFGEEKIFEQQINQISFPGVQAHGQYTGQMANKIAIPLKYRDSITPIHPSTNGRFVKCQYFLQVNPILSGSCVRNNSSFQVTLNISQQPHPVLQVQQPQDWNPEVFKKSHIMLNQNFSNDFIDDMGNKNYF